ncbi:hypothetical protein C8255_25345 [filamentous cyanobacterium CCP3]|nr:hypothetical protein C8255_25345 [filamentous cyanobacterium CCP3]
MPRWQRPFEGAIASIDRIDESVLKMLRLCGLGKAGDPVIRPFMSLNAYSYYDPLRFVGGGDES